MRLIGEMDDLHPRGGECFTMHSIIIQLPSGPHPKPIQNAIGWAVGGARRCHDDRDRSASAGKGMMLAQSDIGKGTMLAQLDFVSAEQRLIPAEGLSLGSDPRAHPKQVWMGQRRAPAAPKNAHPRRVWMGDGLGWDGWAVRGAVTMDCAHRGRYVAAGLVKEGCHGATAQTIVSLAGEGRGCSAAA